MLVDRTRSFNVHPKDDALNNATYEMSRLRLIPEASCLIGAAQVERCIVECTVLWMYVKAGCPVC